MRIRSFLYILTSLFLLSCHTGKTIEIVNRQTEEPIQTTIVNKTILFTPGPATLVYKTKKDYSNNVPIIMNETRSKIISYPAPSDIKYKGRLAIPTPLINGYLLDNRGINKNVAFLSYTYEEYSQLQDTPTIEDLYMKIIDKSPLVELWNCGNRLQYKDIVNELNELINTGFQGCKSEILPSVTANVRTY